MLKAKSCDMDPRKFQILNAIIDEFISTAEPVGSKSVMVNYYLNVSPATIRNEMLILEKEGLIYQPHTSAGRIPTVKGYRLFVDNFDEMGKVEKQAKHILEKVKSEYLQKKAKEKIYDAVSILANATPNISFATVPYERRTFYLGISNILKQPEFMREPMQASQVIEILEENDRFIGTLEDIGVDDSIKIFIGEENLIEKIQSCSIIATKYHFEGYEGIIGILGPTRMNYPFNSVILKEVKKMIE